MRLALAFALSLVIHTSAVVGILSLDPPEPKTKSERMEVNLSYFKKPKEKKSVQTTSGKKTQKKVVKKEALKRKTKRIKKVTQKPKTLIKKQVKRKPSKVKRTAKKEPKPVPSVKKVAKKESTPTTPAKEVEVVKKEEVVKEETKEESKQIMPPTEETPQIARAETPKIPEDYYYGGIPIGIDEEEEEEEFTEETEEALPTPAGEEESEEIKRIIETYLTYPPIARRMGWEGTVVLRFILSKDGSVKEKEITKSSGYEILDKSALKALELASGRLPKPDRDLVVVIPIVYRLEN